MVHPVVAGGVEHLLEPPQLGDGLGVDPVLVQQVDAPCRLDDIGTEEPGDGRAREDGTRGKRRVITYWNLERNRPARKY